MMPNLKEVKSVVAKSWNLELKNMGNISRLFIVATVSSITCGTNTSVVYVAENRSPRQFT